MEIVVVQPGEALWQIARRFGVTVDQLAAANGLSDPSRLVPGIALVVPAPRRYVVRPGDTLWRIANRYGTTPQAIAQYNRISLTGWLYPGQVLYIPRGPRPVIEANGYQANLSAEQAGVARQAAPYLTYISLFSAGITESGDVLFPDADPISAAAHDGGAATLLTLTNFKGAHFNSELGHAFLSSPAAQDRALDQIIPYLSQKGHTGLNVDFEYLFPADRENYNAFLRRAAPRLHAAGFSLSTAVAPKLRREQMGLLYEAHDYRAHGEICDFVILMTYEWGYVSGPPMAIAPLNEVRRVLDYAVTEIPRQKIVMGMPLYGRDWPLPFVRGTTRAETLGITDTVDRAIQRGAAIQYDVPGQSPFYRYWDERGTEHVVWFEDARSVQAKFDTVKEYGLRGVSYWVLGEPFPQNWLLLADNFDVRKPT